MEGKRAITATSFGGEGAGSIWCWHNTGNYKLFIYEEAGICHA